MANLKSPIDDAEFAGGVTEIGAGYRWGVVGLLWFCGFFNYADRLAVNSVFPILQQEFGLSLTRLGALSSSFMVVYALAAPLAGFVVDRTSRRGLIAAGLGFWSLICVATGTARSFGQLLFWRAAEGLGESFYFPASMSVLADYHGPRTRSRAMSLHQTSVYAGTAGGGLLAGHLAARFGWRSPFWFLGLAGMAFAVLLFALLREPVRGAADAKKPGPAEAPPDLAAGVAEIVRVPAALALLAAFAGANFVATALMSWLPMFVFVRFRKGVFEAAVIGTLFMPLASLVGAVVGGALADWAARRRPGGRMVVQGTALLLGTPAIVVVGMTGSVPVLLAALVGIGLCKGVYDANIFASVYDVIRTPVRGTAAGLMNTVGWAGGSLAPVVIGLGGDRFGLGLALTATAAVYVVAAGAALAAARLAGREGGLPSPRGGA